MECYKPLYNDCRTMPECGELLQRDWKLKDINSDCSAGHCGFWRKRTTRVVARYLLHLTKWTDITQSKSKSQVNQLLLGFYRT